MRFSISIQFLALGLFPLLFIGLAGCSDSDSASNPGDPSGDWLTVSLENVTQGIRVDCPGQSGSLECGTATLSLDASGVMTILATTDETGAPDPFRYEGIWRTEGDQLTLELREQGEDAGNLSPIDPPDLLTGTYALSEDTLTFAAEEEDGAGDTLVSTYERL
jgi:hypothetical protein